MGFALERATRAQITFDFSFSIHSKIMRRSLALVESGKRVVQTDDRRSRPGHPAFPN